MYSSTEYCNYLAMAKTILLFGDSRTIISRILLEGFLKLQNQSQELRVVGLCDTGCDTRIQSFLTQKKITVAHRIRDLFNHGYHELLQNQVPTMGKLARDYGIPVLWPESGDINHSSFIQKVKKELCPDIAINFYCLQIFKSDLLNVFQAAVNFHTGLLPDYRGLKTTEWSIYNREDMTGFTFHVMNERIDDGPILLKEGLPVNQDRNPSQIELKKALIARGKLPELSELLLRDASGVEQTEPGRYFSRKDFEAVTRIEDPSKISSDELEKRLHAFQVLNVTLKGREYPVTGLEVVPDLDTGLSFKTKEGVCFKVNRLRFMPNWLYFVFLGLGLEV